MNRVFANNQTYHFSDYYNVLKGNEIYKNIRSKGKFFYDTNYTIQNNETSRFLSYDMFLILTRSYFRHYVKEKNLFNPPFSIIDGKTSIIKYKDILSHIKSCDYCCKCSNIL